MGSPLQNESALSEQGLEDGGEVVLVRVQPYNGKYEVDIDWNGTYTVELLGTHAKVTTGDKGFEAEIDWQEPQKAVFSGLRFVTTYWAKYHSDSEHSAEQGVEEKFEINFHGDAGAAGFEGTFQRQYEG